MQSKVRSMAQKFIARGKLAVFDQHQLSPICKSRGKLEHRRKDDSENVLKGNGPRSRWPSNRLASRRLRPCLQQHHVSVTDLFAQANGVAFRGDRDRPCRMEIFGGNRGVAGKHRSRTGMATSSFDLVLPYSYLNDHSGI